MGMYTELHFNAELRKDVPQEVLNVLSYMLDSDKDRPALPDHPLFRTQRWLFMLTCDSYYFDADTHSTLRFDEIFDFHENRPGLGLQFHAHPGLGPME